MSTRRLENLLGAAALAVTDRIDRATRGVAGMTGGAAAALLTIGTRPHRPIEHLSRTLGLSHSGTVRLVDRLADRGWVERSRPGAGREVHLTLTAGGRRVFEELLEARRWVLRELITPVPEGDRAALEDALATLLESLPRVREDAWNICRLCEHRVCRDDACPVGRAAGGLEIA